MSAPAIGDRYEDPRRRRDGSVRIFNLNRRVNPQGDTPPFWVVESVDTGRTSTIRENRLSKYRVQESA